MSLLLALDTSNRRGGAVALARDGEILSTAEHDPAQGYAEAVFALIDEVLRAPCLSLDDVEGLAVIRGPGSYTGLRIGVMTAKALAFARELPLYAAGSLEALASAPLREREIASALAITEAGGGHVYAATYTSAGGKIVLRDEAE